MGTENLIIVGGGPAGYTAAIYAARAGLSPLLIEGPQPGGQLMITTDVENYPGFRDGVMGPVLMDEMREQARRFGTRIVNDYVQRVEELGSTYKKVETVSEQYGTRAVIFATGAKAKLTGLPGEQTYWGKGISACATCDGFFFRGKDVAILGGGDTAMEEALFLANICNRVYVIHRRNEFRASKIMQDRVLAHPKIQCIMDVTTREFQGGPGDNRDTLGLVVYRPNDRDAASVRSVDVQGAFIAIGHQPATDFLRGKVALDTSGYIKTDGVKVTQWTESQTGHSFPKTLPGVFAAGDCVDKIYRQAITAAGEGCKAAIEAERYLSHMSLK